ncbi:hypothetical protein [Veronia pacifica]|uniref:Uncharacterized protein n=1 Tax=Veronia pacifica TaxID=1080227 RepID=A0A1C3EDA0_9GAMM|nr:hypothetical protein [Veronia pacifica]ODA31221.1 hypothetical protein A8L45_17830 [Veronia pacifica]
MTFIPTFNRAVVPQMTATPQANVFTHPVPFHNAVQTTAVVPVTVGLPQQAPDASLYYMSRLLKDQGRVPFMAQPAVVPGLGDVINRLDFNSLSPFKPSPIGFPSQPFLQGFGAPGAGLGFTPLEQLPNDAPGMMRPAVVPGSIVPISDLELKLGQTGHWAPAVMPGGTILTDGDFGLVEPPRFEDWVAALPGATAPVVPDFKLNDWLAPPPPPENWLAVQPIQAPGVPGNLITFSDYTWAQQF